MLRRVPVGSIDPVYLRTALLAAAAVVVSYALGSATSFIAADIAAIWALIMVRATFHAAVRESAVQIAGTIIGGLVGWLTIQSYGFSLWLLAGLVLFSFALGFLLRLGVEGSAIIGFTMIVVISNSFSFESTEARVAGVVLGTVVAVFFSLFTSRGTPQKRVRTRLDNIRERKQQVLTSLSESVTAGSVRVQDTFELKLQSEIIIEDIEKLEDEARELVSASKWSPLTSTEEADLLLNETLQTKDDAYIVLDMVESVETLGAAIPDSVAAYARYSIAAATRAILSREYEDEFTSEIPALDYSVVDLTPTQVIYTSDLLASTEKLRKRRRYKAK